MKDKSKNHMDITKKLILVGSLVGTLFWIIESFLEVFVFNRRGNFLYYLFPPEIHIIYHRLVVVGLLIIFVALTYFTIIKHKKSEEVLKKERDKVQKYLDVAGVMMVVIDADQKVTLINKKGCEILGYDEDEIIGKNWFDNFIPKEIKHKVKAVFEMLMLGEIKPAEYHENPVLTKSGDEKIIAWHNIILKDEEGNIISALSSGEDITERKRSEEDRKLLLDNMTALVWYLKDEQTHGAVNKALADFMGVEKSAIEHKSLFEVFRKEEAEVCIADNRKVFKEKKAINTKEWVVNADGEPRLLSITKTPKLSKDGNVEYMVCSAVDITERKRMEDGLLQSKRDWENTFNTITDMIFIYNKDFNLVRANKAAEKILKMPHLEINKISNCCKYYQGKDCPPEWGFNCEYFKEGKPMSIEFFEPGLNMFVEIRAIPRFDNNNRFIGLINVVRDITERKKIEEELIRTQKLSSLGRMLAGIGHEIKNPLEGIGMVLKSLQNSFGEQDVRRQDTIKILNKIRSLEKLLDNIVKFSRPRALTLGKADITVSIENSLVFVNKALIDKNIKVEKVYLHNGLKILFDPEAMQQVFINLFLNAIDSMNNNGILNINVHEIKNGQIGQIRNPVASYGNLREFMEPGIRIIIQDTGCGIKKENLEKIFEPYFTTNQRKTGLGLYIVHQIVSGHKGKINIYSKEGEGTRCVITLPFGYV